MPISIPPFTNVPSPDDPIQSAWAQQLTQYAVDHVNDITDAHDASAISFAPVGTIAATTVQEAIAEVATEAGAAAVELSALPRGYVTHAEISTPTNIAAGTVADITGSTVTWDADPNRYYKITATLGHVVLSGTVAATPIAVYITDHLNETKAFAQQSNILQVEGNAPSLNFSLMAVESGLYGSQTRKLRLTNGTNGAIGTSPNINMILVEDIGAV